VPARCPRPPHAPLLFSTIRPPPSSTLFPYTTLFRSCARARRASSTTRSSHVGRSRHPRRPRRAPRRSQAAARDLQGARRGLRGRSEEHTSELQSPCNLVCRLLLEKKKRLVKTGIPGR